jgi:hypothetical protein
VDLVSFQVQSVALGSPPRALGHIAAAGAVYVTQSHAAGRITFVDTSTRKTRTVTGFELNAYITQ